VTAPPGWVDPNTPTANMSPHARLVLGGAAAALTLVVVATLVVVVIASKGIDSTSGPGSGDVVLTAANASVTNPFSRSVVLDRTPASQEATQHIADVTARTPYFPDRGVRLASGTQPGLYGTRGSTRPCDAPAAASALQSHPAKGEAWATAIGLRFAQIPYYLNTLTPVKLTVDTWVTSHGYADGQATTFQTVLQAGNAVMIDEAGVPRVHCESVDPLGPPANRNLADMKQTGKPWQGLDGQNVVAIAYTAGTSASAVSEFTLIDTDTGAPVIREAGNTINLAPASPGMLPNPVTMNAAPSG
jgi:hypothetical protein